MRPMSCFLTLHCRRTALALLAGTTSLVLLGCASMTPEQCKVADWYQVGLQDGRQGERPQDKLGDYAKDCAEVGVRPDGARYQAGWNAGIRDFCTPFSGWREGTQGRSYKSGACRGQMGEWPFEQALRNGLEVHRTEQSLRNHDSEIRRLERLLQDKETPERERREIRDRLRWLDYEQSRLRRLLADQERMAPR